MVNTEISISSDKAGRMIVIIPTEAEGAVHAHAEWLLENSYVERIVRIDHYGND